MKKSIITLIVISVILGFVLITNPSIEKGRDFVVTHTGISLLEQGSTRADLLVCRENNILFSKFYVKVEDGTDPRQYHGKQCEPIMIGICGLFILTENKVESEKTLTVELVQCPNECMPLKK